MSDALVVGFGAFVSPYGVLRCVSGALMAVLVAGCLPAPTQQAVTEDWNKGWARFQSTDWNDMATKLTGLDLHTDHDLIAERDDDRTLCLNRNSEERVLSENGKSDYVQYRRCPVTPYPTRSLGERLSPGHIDPVEQNIPN